MALFELFIPAADPSGFNVTARVRADSWMQALRAGLAKLGDTADIRNVIVDITEQGIDVTESASGRVFRIRELPEAAPQVAAPAALLTAAAAAAAPPPVAAPSAPAPSAVAVPPGGATQSPVAPAPAPVAPAPVAVAAQNPPATAVPVAAAAAAPTRAAPPAATQGPPPAAARSAPSAAALAAARPSSAPRPVTPPVSAPPRFVAQVLEETVAKERPVAASSLPAPVIGRSKGESTVSSSDDIISDLFAQTQALYDQGDLRGAAGYILDLAMKSVQADSGAVFIADISASDLYFAAARGPKAQEAMKFRVPLGQGIVGFCAQEGVALAVSDVHRDPRFYAAVSKNIGYETRSILCVPAQVHGRVVGAIELINKRAGTSFTGGEISVLNFLAHEFADYMLNTEQTGA